MRKLIIFDADGVLMDTDSVWKTIHEFLGVENHPERVEAKRKFMSGEISYQEWADKDVELMKNFGATREKIITALGKVRLIAGAMEAIRHLKKKGYKVGIVSDGLDIGIKTLIPDYDLIFDYVYVNRMLFDRKGGLLRVEITEFNGEKKADALKRICGEEHISLKDSVFVGDHFNDVEIAKISGFSIAFNPKSEKLEEVSDVVIKKKDLREILKYL